MASRSGSTSCSAAMLTFRCVHVRKCPRPMPHPYETKLASNSMLMHVMGYWNELTCEAICQAIGSVDLGAVHQGAHEIIKHLRNSDDLLQALEKGVSLPGARNQGYKDIEAQNGKVIGLINRFKIDIDIVLFHNKNLPKSGIILSVFDQESLMPPEADVKEPLIQPPAE